ncbi:hypothetical protein IV203_016068 [Nitzschia inconspicua]|uniref:Uncharacterized protein n=1 Tax=Nitzschia inconspicua TaxID=303405 RepID=A0A9K3KP29_9STRA|nr:hypothetical protein IV203_016068 [Nitzschia inconspicua]
MDDSVRKNSIDKLCDGALQLLKQDGQDRNQQQCCERARSWSLDSYSTIATADVTRDFSEQEHSFCIIPSVIWEGNTPVEINVPSFPLSRATNKLLQQHKTKTHDDYCYSTPIDLDLMDDYYKYENSQETTGSQFSKDDSFLTEEDESAKPLIRSKVCRNPSGGLEEPLQLPERFTQFEI